MSEFSTFLDKIFEGGIQIADKVLDRDIAQSEAKAQDAARAAEEARQRQIEAVTTIGYDQGNFTLFGQSFPSWFVPAALIGFGGILLLKKVK